MGFKLSYDYIESDKNQDYKFNHYFDYNNDSQIIELNGEFSQDFFNKYIGYMKDSLDFINKDFGKNMSSNDLLIQVTILTMLSVYLRNNLQWIIYKKRLNFIITLVKMIICTRCRWKYIHQGR